MCRRSRASRVGCFLHVYFDIAGAQRHRFERRTIRHLLDASGAAHLRALRLQASNGHFVSDALGHEIHTDKAWRHVIHAACIEDT